MEYLTLDQILEPTWKEGNATWDIRSSDRLKYEWQTRYTDTNVWGDNSAVITKEYPCCQGYTALKVKGTRCI